MLSQTSQAALIPAIDCTRSAASCPLGAEENILWIKGNAGDGVVKPIQEMFAFSPLKIPQHHLALPRADGNYRATRGKSKVINPAWHSGFGLAQSRRQKSPQLRPVCGQLRPG